MKQVNEKPILPLAVEQTQSGQTLSAPQIELVRRLHCTAGHLQGIAGMVERGEPCEKLVYQMVAVEAALHQVNRLILNYHLSFCLAQQWQAGQAARERGCAELLALYRLLND